MRDRHAVEDVGLARVVAHDEQHLVVGAVVAALEREQVDAGRPRRRGREPSTDRQVEQSTRPGVALLVQHGLRVDGHAEDGGEEPRTRAAVAARAVDRDVVVRPVERTFTSTDPPWSMLRAVAKPSMPAMPRVGRVSFGNGSPRAAVLDHDRAPVLQPAALGVAATTSEVGEEEAAAATP